MLFLRSVQADTYGKALGGQKATPVVIEERAVGLNAIGDAPVRGLMLALQRHNLLKVIEFQNGRLRAIPGKIDHLTRESIDLLDNIPLQNAFRHTQ